MTSNPPSVRPDPDEAFLLHRAVALHRDGRLAEAAQLYRRILDAVPTHLAALHLLGLVCHQQGRHAEALDLIAAALRREPVDAAVLSNHGLVLQALGRLDEAIRSWDRALTIDPRHAAALNNRGTALRELKRFDGALDSFDRAIEIAPGFVDAISNRGMALHDLARYEEAVACFDRAIALDPGHALAHNNRGAALHALRRFDAALASFDRAIAIRPDYAAAFYNRGHSLKALMRHDDAVASYTRAAALDPAHSAAHWDAALLRLLRGDFAAGWEAYEWRFRAEEAAVAPRDFRPPRWDGTAPLAGRTILLHAEQGFGDTIQFVRYVPLVAARGARIVLEVQPALRSLIEGMAGVAMIVGRGDALPPFDLHCPLPSLPLAFRSTLDTIPARMPYLQVPTDRLAAWKGRLPEAGRLVGVVWSGNPRHLNDRKRSIALPALTPLLTLPGITFVSLQKDPRPGDIEALHARGNVLDVAVGLQDFADTAAVISRLDLLITVDTSVAHLAGALGKPVWILLPVDVDWRWLLDRADSPWYPSARLFRQGRADDWDEVMARVRGALADFR